MWTGAYVEPDSDVGPFNTLDPQPGRYIAPWARSDVPGNAKGGNKFDLRRFNSTFFKRLTAFVDAAASHNIIVEVGLFGGYEQTHEAIWRACPFHPSNNINVVPGSVNRTTVYSLSAPAELRTFQIETARQIATALRTRPNVYYQLVNVPNHSSPAWGEPIRQALLDADPLKMIAVPAAWARAGFKANVSILNFGAFARPSDARQAPMQRAALAYDESGGLPGGRLSYRSSFWQWMLAGGAIVDNLDWSFMADGYENGTLPAKDCHDPRTSGSASRAELAALSGFVHGLPFVGMAPNVSWLAEALVPPLRGHIQVPDYEGTHQPWAQR